MSESPLLSQVLRSDGHEILQQGRISFWGCVWNQADERAGGTRIHWREVPWLLRELTPHADWKQPDLSKHRTCQEGDM